MPTNTIIVTARYQDPFARVLKSMLEDSTLSWKAKGILSYLLGQPRDWKPRVKDLARRGTDGQNAIRAALAELRAQGYACLDRRYENGKIAEWIWKVADRPVFKGEKLDHENLEVENLEVGNQYRTKKKQLPRKNTASKRSSKDLNSIIKRNTFLKLWCEAFEVQHGIPYHLTSYREKADIGKLVTSLKETPEQLIGLVKQAWSNPQGFWCSRVKSLSAFVHHFNDIRIELNGGVKNLISLRPGVWRTAEQMHADTVQRLRAQMS